MQEFFLFKPQIVTNNKTEAALNSFPDKNSLFPKVKILKSNKSPKMKDFAEIGGFIQTANFEKQFLNFSHKKGYKYHKIMTVRINNCSSLCKDGEWWCLLSLKLFLILIFLKFNPCAMTKQNYYWLIDVIRIISSIHCLVHLI